MNLNIPMPSGYRLLANYRNLVVLAEAENKETPEPYVTWLVINGSDVQMGKYFASFGSAEKSFFEQSLLASSSVEIVSKLRDNAFSVSFDVEEARSNTKLSLDWAALTMQADKEIRMGISELH